MKRRWANFFGIFLMFVLTGYFLSATQDIFVLASKVNLNGVLSLRFAQTTYHMQFHQLASTDELKISKDLLGVHQIQERVSPTYSSENGDLMIVMAKSIDQNLVLVVFKDQQIQMIQKITQISENTLKLQYGDITVNPETTQLGLSENAILEF